MRNSLTRHHRKATPTSTPKPPTLEEQVRQITEALRIYAEASGGFYPGKTVYDSYGTTEDLCKMLGLVKFPAGEKEGNAGKANKAYRGFELISTYRFL